MGSWPPVGGVARARAVRGHAAPNSDLGCPPHVILATVSVLLVLVLILFCFFLVLVVRPTPAPSLAPPARGHKDGLGRISVHAPVNVNRRASSELGGRLPRRPSVSVRGCRERGHDDWRGFCRPDGPVRPRGEGPDGAGGEAHDRQDGVRRWPPSCLSHVSPRPRPWTDTQPAIHQTGLRSPKSAPAPLPALPRLPAKQEVKEGELVLLGPVHRPQLAPTALTRRPSHRSAG